MKLNRLTLTDYRNIQQANLSPGSELTVLCGKNGQGKTNLLEAIWLLTGGKSFRAGKDEELILRGQPFSVLEADITAQEREQNMRLTVGSRVSQRPGRTVRLNGVDRGRASTVAGTFTAVVFHPGHLSLVKGSPEGRRKFLDIALCQLYPNYLALLRRYTRIVTQKNSLLKHFNETPDGGTMLEIFNRELASCGEELTRRRVEYLEHLKAEAAANYREISNGREQLEIGYIHSFGEKGLLKKLEEVRPVELKAGFCLAGPHREDMEILLDGQEAKIYASQGQQRSAVLSLKLAEAARAAEVTGEHPVMLLDDVLSELDDSRQSYLLTRMEDKQTFVTSCDSAAFTRTNGKIVLLDGGTVREV